jgi:hypothetical protein
MKKKKVAVLKQMIDTIAAAKLLGYTTHTLKKWRVEGKGPAYYKVRGQVLYKRAELEAFADELVVRIDPKAADVGDYHKRLERTVS